MIQETLSIAIDADLLCEMGWATQPPGLSLCPHRHFEREVFSGRSEPFLST